MNCDTSHGLWPLGVVSPNASALCRRGSRAVDRNRDDARISTRRAFHDQVAGSPNRAWAAAKSGSLHRQDDRPELGQHVDVCPVGALTNKVFRSRRAWELIARVDRLSRRAWFEPVAAHRVGCCARCRATTKRSTSAGCRIAIAIRMKAARTDRDQGKDSQDMNWSKRAEEGSRCRRRLKKKTLRSRCAGCAADLV